VVSHQSPPNFVGRVLVIVIGHPSPVFEYDYEHRFAEHDDEGCWDFAGELRTRDADVDGATPSGTQKKVVQASSP
jgi:hypothetical protein